MTIVFRILITAFALLVCAYLVPGITVENIYIALLAAVVLGLLNLTARPVLLLLSLPLTILTFGLFIFVVNAVVFGFTAYVISGFSVDGFLPALVGSLVVSLAGALANRFLP